ncbi:FAD-dependent oxidoreductase [Neorhizobium alkalisoli]|uniref:2-polyprenyl-6-methoxyphenol hydroxylase-like FAD-dependent oxidoreductase n=1 Tax=Neorhizobium alkalisoli TaxID=528178 RepID=A0A561QHD9_9HYPH|nr:NAD(P)/FAD-dependent oxidoreductase [Neorhizobium alkalisoli]TWF49795.1 2-polyprenyl-6-methoxyphenol hydroxylase-like FAD-dependent oxidoreductase [Neorhizobium alkalisoli]
MKLETLDIAIAGAGMGGLSLGAMLAARGAKVTVYDQMTAPQPVGSGFVLQPTGQAVLSAMGLLDEAGARGAKIFRMHGRLAGQNGEAGRTVLEIGYGKDRQGQDGHGIAIQRVALFDILLKAATDAGVRFETSSRAVEVMPGERPVICLEGGRKAPAADLVIDAMGAGSPIGHDPAKELGYGALWATVPWPVEAPAEDTFHPNELEQRYERATRMAGVLPVGTAGEGAAPMATFFWSLRNRDIDRWRAEGRQAWIEAVAKLWPEAARFAEIAEPVHARYRHHTRKPVAGRNVLRIGDAWHATSPQLGQGANMALLDAASLVTALMRSKTREEAIRLHLSQRQMHIRLYQLLSLVLTPYYQSDSRILPLLRDLMIAPVTRMPVIRGLVSRLVTGDVLDPIGRIGILRS